MQANESSSRTKKRPRISEADPDSGELQPLSDGPGEQADPVVLATKSGEFAMGVFSPDQPSPGWERVGYGRFRFPRAKVVKWNCVFRLTNRDEGIQSGEYAFRCFVVVGDRETVRASLLELASMSHYGDTEPQRTHGE